MRLAFLLFLLCLSGCSSSQKILTFSSTQKWDQNYYRFVEKDAFESAKILRQFAISNFSANDSVETRAELENLKNKQIRRSPEEILFIKKTADYRGVVFHHLSLPALFKKFPETNRLFFMQFNKLTTITFTLKSHYDRVRPSFLDKSLNPPIPVPGHASYPSGHAVSLYVLGALLSMVDPLNSAIYFNSAAKASEAREIAGLHYPSDTMAGKVVAELFVEHLKSDKNFLLQLSKARKEFNDLKQSF